MQEMGVLCDFHGTLVDANKAWIKAFETYGIPDINQVITDVYHKVNRKIICHRYGIDYEEIKGISLEGRQKLNKFKPRSIGQASRISGVSPADVSVLLITLQEIKDKGK